MKEVKQKSKQSVWLLTMLTVMIVLSAYYLISEPLVYDDLVKDNNIDISDNNNEIPIFENDIFTDDIISDITTTDTSNQEEEEYTQYIDQITASSNDAIVALKMEKNDSRSKQIDSYYTMMQTNLSEEAISEIYGKIENLQITDEAEYIIEKLIIADGYTDAVVFTNNGSVDVIVQTEVITNSEAVKIIKLVSERLDIPAVNIHIKTVS